MFFLPGTKVYLKYSLQWALVEDIDMDGFLTVICEDDQDRIAVHKEDVLMEDEYAFYLLEKEKTESAAKELALDAHPKPDTKGFFLELLSDPGDQIAEEYQVWLWNLTDFPCHYEGKMESLEGVLFEENDLLDTGGSRLFCELFREDISMQSRLDLNLDFEVGTQKVHKSLRFKFQAKKLLQLEGQEWGDKLSRWVLLVEDKGIQEVSRPILVQPKHRLPMVASERNYVQLEVTRKAAFPMDIDLHAEKLFIDAVKKTNAEILHAQLQAFERYLDEAVRLGMDRVFVIHGIGEGKLKERIHQRLEGIDSVQSFRNEYHPKYGWGATEIIL